MFLSNRRTEQNAMKNKEKLKQRVISPKLPPSQPVEHLCVLFSAKNDAMGCQRLPVGFPRVSLSCILPSPQRGKEQPTNRKEGKISDACTEPRSHLSSTDAYSFSPSRAQHVSVSHRL